LIILATALLGCSTRAPYVPDPSAVDSENFKFTWENSSQPTAKEVAYYPNVANILDGTNPILSLYREDVTHKKVEEFFVQLTGSPEIALPILYHADRNDLSLSLVFSLAWVESKFTPSAENWNHKSVDRGLFQLNSNSFYHLTREDFFDPEINASHGTEYLKFCLKYAPNERLALAAYNAGLSRVKSGDIPKSTQEYVRKVIAYKRALESRFRRYILKSFPPSPS